MKQETLDDDKKINKYLYYFIFNWLLRDYHDLMMLHDAWAMVHDLVVLAA